MRGDLSAYCGYEARTHLGRIIKILAAINSDDQPIESRPIAGRVAANYKFLGKVDLMRRVFTRCHWSARPQDWMKPKLVVQVEFLEWTGGDKMRHPRY